MAPRVPPVPAKPTQAEQDEQYATGHAAYRSWCDHCVKSRGRASPHAVASEGELPEVGVDYAYLGPEGSQVTILVCKRKRTFVPGCDTVASEGHACLCSSLLYWMAVRNGMETIVVEVR